MNQSYANSVAEKIIDQLEKGTAPWQKPWEPGEVVLPYNPTTGKSYRGINTIWLFSQGYSDPRWMTFNQARKEKLTVRKGSKGTKIEYWQFTRKEPMRDSRGKVVKRNGSTVYLEDKLARPLVARFTVFNGEQIKGLPELEKQSSCHSWSGDGRADNILKASGAEIKHIAGNRAYYSPLRDQIVLPKRAQFATSDRYYATALHELGHWSGHESRLDRDMGGVFGSERYAKEELRAEIFSFMLCGELGLGHDPGQHVAYVDHWIKSLEEDPREVFRASADAAKILTYIRELEKSKNISKDVQLEKNEHIGNDLSL